MISQIDAISPIDQQPTSSTPVFEVERALEFIHKIGRIIQTFSHTKLNQLFDEYDICNSLLLTLSSIQKELLAINPDATQVLIASARGIPDQTNSKRAIQTVRGGLQTLNHSLELIKAVGTILDFLLVDSYQFE